MIIVDLSQLSFIALGLVASWLVCIINASCMTFISVISGLVFPSTPDIKYDTRLLIFVVVVEIESDLTTEREN